MMGAWQIVSPPIPNLPCSDADGTLYNADWTDASVPHPNHHPV
jgi:hypothetical protein